MPQIYYSIIKDNEIYIRNNLDNYFITDKNIIFNFINVQVKVCPSKYFIK
jgi:hypothetical protein